MEDTLRVKSRFLVLVVRDVLILVLMEDTLRVTPVIFAKKVIVVLILVLMEDTLRVDSRDYTTHTVVS